MRLLGAAIGTQGVFGWAVLFGKAAVSYRKAVVGKAEDRLVRAAVKL